MLTTPNMVNNCGLQRKYYGKTIPIPDVTDIKYFICHQDRTAGNMIYFHILVTIEYTQTSHHATLWTISIGNYTSFITEQEQAFEPGWLPTSNKRSLLDKYFNAHGFNT